MSLTGPVLQWGTVLAAVLAAAAVVVGWGRLARPGALAVLARSGALVGVNAVIVVALLVSANDHYVFYSGWDDLLGTGAPAALAVAGALPRATAPGTGAAAATSAALLAGTTHPTAPEGTDVPGDGGRVQELQVHGPAGTSSSALVVLPPGHHDASASRTTYPVVVALHGYPGNPRQWLTALDVRPAIATAVAAHRLAEPIVVIPNLAVPARRDTECLDGPAGQPQVETWLAQDLPRAVEASYRVRTSPQAWAAMGFSMGGWCSAVLTMLHPQQYGAGIVMGGYFRYDPGSYLPFPASQQAQQHDLVALAASAPPAVSMFVASSQDDPESWPTTKPFLAAVRAPMSVTSLVSRTGGHRSDVWKAQMPQALTWLGATEPGFAPTA